MQYRHNTWAPAALQAFSVIILYRCWSLLTPGTLTWVLASLATALADIAWRCGWPGSYTRWRELPAALLCLNAFGPAAAWLLMRRLLDDHASAVGGFWGCAARLLFASGAAKMAANALSLRVRLRWGGGPSRGRPRGLTAARRAQR